MYCKRCKCKMVDTHSTSYGTGQPIYKCPKCGWTKLRKN